MYEACIQNFLHRSDPACVERHSDSSDFENSCPIPVVTPKSGNHSLLTGKPKNSKREKEYRNRELQVDTIENFNVGQTTKYLRQQSQSTKTYYKKRVPLIDSKSIGLKTCTHVEKFTKKDDKRNRGDQSSTYYLEKNNSSRSLVKNKILPCLSQMLRRSNNNYYQHLTSIKEKDSVNIQTKALVCATDKPDKDNKNRRRRKKYAVQPVYTVKDIEGFPIISNQTYDRVTSPHYENLDKINSNICHSATTTSTSEEEMKRNYNYETIIKKFERRTPKDLKKTKAKYYNKEQQCSSKLMTRSLYQVFTSSCQVKSSLNDAGALAKLDSNSSAFWSFLADKVNKRNPIPRKIPDLPKSCDCEKAILSCSPETCKRLETGTETEFYEQFIPQSPPILSLNIPKKTSKVIKTKEEEKVECKCYPEKTPQLMKQTKSSSSNDDSKPCQETHDDITKAISAKYKGEILCIHNPPCILINGCLNMPPPKTPVQANFWPVTHSKKSSFVQMCRKIKRKQKGSDQSSQYHEPLTELEQCLPEFRTEKIIQSICNHSPPCQIVHGCFKPKYDPKLANSCVHVPMCEKVPECVIDRKSQDIRTNMCQHSPKCAELPICSRKYIVLTSKESTATQVYPATKMVCRHNPPCLLLPKCLAQWMCSGHVPWDVIPGCSHHPRCEQIPACCTKSARDMVSVTSQYPTAPCRIV